MGIQPEGDANGKAVDQLKSIGALISQGLALLAGLAPIFGEKGLNNIIPLPANFQAIGPPLTTMISLALVLGIFIYGKDRPKSRGPWITALSCGLGSIVLFALYLSWIQDNRVEVPFDALSIIANDVIALFVNVFAIALMTATFALLGVAFLQAESAPPGGVVQDLDQAEAGQKPSPGKVTKDPVSEKAGFKYSIDSLHMLVLAAEWEMIHVLGSAGPRFGYWKLFYAIADLILKPAKANDPKVLSKTRRQARVVSVLNWSIPQVVNPNKNKAHLLDNAAQDILETLSQDGEFSRKLSELGPNEHAGMFKLTLNRFLAGTAFSFSIGIDRIYTTLRDSLRDTVKLYKLLGSRERSSFSLDASKTVLERLRKQMVVSLFEDSKNDPYQIFQDFHYEIGNILAGGDIVSQVTGVLKTIQQTSLRRGREVLKIYDRLPEGSAKIITGLYAFRIYAIGAAAIAVEGSTEDIMSIKPEKGLSEQDVSDLISSYTTAVDWVVQQALILHQGLAACRMASEYREVAMGIVGKWGQKSDPLTAKIDQAATVFIRKAEARRMMPCSQTF
jgi:hypothetical protein